MWVFFILRLFVLIGNYFEAEFFYFRISDLESLFMLMASKSKNACFCTCLFCMSSAVSTFSEIGMCASADSNDRQLSFYGSEFLDKSVSQFELSYFCTKPLSQQLTSETRVLQLWYLVEHCDRCLKLVACFILYSYFSIS